MNHVSVKRGPLGASARKGKRAPSFGGSEDRPSEWLGNARVSDNTIQITPFMHVADLEAALLFLTETLGFVVRHRDANYAYIEREGAAIRMLEHDDPDEFGAPHRGFAYYIDVRDLGRVLAELGPKLAGLPPGDVYGPVDQPYNQRELMVRAPDGNLMVFGQAIGRN